MAKETEIFRKAWLLRTGCILAGIAAFIAISLWMYMPWWELALRSDKSPVSWLSSALLFTCAVLALQLTTTQATISKTLAAWLAVAMLALSLDEQFQLHEYWKYHCNEWVGWCAVPEAGRVDWLADAPMMLVGLGGITTVAGLYRSIANTVAKNLLVAAVATGVLLALGTHFGHAAGLLPAWFNRFEEVYEVLAEALFLCALLEVSAAPFSDDSTQVQSASSL